LAPDVPRSNSIGQRPFFKSVLALDFQGVIRQSKVKGDHIILFLLFISPSSVVVSFTVLYGARINKFGRLFFIIAVQ